MSFDGLWGPPTQGICTPLGGTQLCREEKRKEGNTLVEFEAHMGGGE